MPKSLKGRNYDSFLYRHSVYPPMQRLDLRSQENFKNLAFSKSIGVELLRLPEIIDQWKPSRGYILKFYNKTKRNPNRCIIFVHGGGFTKNQPLDDTYKTLCAILAHQTGYDVYCPDYTLFPMASYPVRDTNATRSTPAASGYRKGILRSYWDLTRQGVLLP